MALLAAEVRKLTTVRSTWILTFIGLALVVLQVGATVVAGLLEPFTGSPDQVADAMTAVGGNSAIVLVVGLLSMTTEFRHGTVGRTLQLTPSRTRVLVAKLAAGAVYAVGFVVLAALTVAITLWIGALVQGVSLQPDGQAFETFWQGLVGSVLTAVLGVAFGALVRQQIVAVVVALVWIFIVENLFAALLPDIGRWFPFQALNGLFIPEAAMSQMPDGAFVPLTAGPALAVFAAYVVVFSVAAGALLRYRDV